MRICNICKGSGKLPLKLVIKEFITNLVSLKFKIEDTCYNCKGTGITQ